MSRFWRATPLTIGLSSLVATAADLNGPHFFSTALAASRRPSLEGVNALVPFLNASQASPSRPFILILALGLLTLLPFVIIMVTSFVKISVVLSIIRSALGTPQIPPTLVITGLSIVLTVYIMSPVGLAMYRHIASTEDLGVPISPKGTTDIGRMFQVAQKAQEPLRAFLKRHAHPNELAMFYGMAKRLRSKEDEASVQPDDFLIIVPAFVISELKEAFQIGFILFVPFLVIDMTVANILMALGMQMLSPTTISLPFKLLLFVMVDGWYMITKGLISGYI